MGGGASLCTENVLSLMELELLFIAFKAGATVDEIMEVLKLGVIQGVQACDLGVTILAEELGHQATA